tara:strand:- start:130 stop:486 length:357 start_codon:yes stop_codon:yes gene_type:complete
MLRLALAFVLGLTIVPCAIAQESQDKRFHTQQACDHPLKMTDIVVGKYGEQPLFKGIGIQFHVTGTPYQSAVMFFTNQETGTWSMISLYPDGTACMIANGTKFEPYSGPPIPSKDNAH